MESPLPLVPLISNTFHPFQTLVVILSKKEESNFISRKKNQHI